MSRIEELEQKRAAKLEARAAAEAAQYEKDLEARFDIEDEHGPVAAVKVPVFREGHPTRAYVRSPSSAEYKRYKDLVHRAVDRKQSAGTKDAIEQLARASWIYPSDDAAQSAMLDAFPGLLTTISLAATSLAEGKGEDEGKG